MSLAALLAVVAMPLAPAQADPPTEFPVSDAHDGVVTDGSLYYRSSRGGRGTIRRVELDSGRKTTVFTAPNRRTHLSELEAGGGRVAVETTANGVRILALDAATGAIAEIARGHDYERRDCGRTLKLHDVSPSGEILYEEAVVRCGRRRGRQFVRAHSSGSGTRTLTSRGTDTVFISMDAPYRSLAGDQLVSFGSRIARVRNTVTGAVRRFRPADRLSTLARVSVAADGRLIINEFRFMGRDRPRQTITLVDPSGARTAVYRTRRAFGETLFCGERPVMNTFSQRGRMRLRILDPPQEVFDGSLRDWDSESSCDGSHFVLVVRVHGEPNLVQVYELPT
jgi:hypothetical protein